MEPLSPLAARLLEAARDGHEPSPAELAKTLHALHARLDFPDLPGLEGDAAPAPLAAASTAAPTLGSKLAGAASGKALKLALASLVLGGAISGAVLLHAAPAPATHPPALVVTAPASRSTDAITEQLVVAPTRPPTNDAVAPSIPRKPSHRSQRELRLIGRALTALRDDAPERALALLKQHASRFPRGQFVTERDGLRVLALCAAGRIDAGTRARAAFLQQAPHAPIAARVRLACESGSAR